MAVGKVAAVALKQQLTAGVPFDLDMPQCSKLQLLVCGLTELTLEQSADGIEYETVALDDLPAEDPPAEAYQIDLCIAHPYMRFTAAEDVTVIALYHGCRCPSSVDAIPVIDEADEDDAKTK